MLVIATGPRSSGTSLLYRILCTGSEKFPLHIPAFPPWFQGRDWAEDFPTAVFVVCLRDLAAASCSATKRGLAGRKAAFEEQTMAREYLTGLRKRAADRTMVVKYEELTHDPLGVVEGITAFLWKHGYDGEPLSIPEVIHPA